MTSLLRQYETPAPQPAARMRAIASRPRCASSRPCAGATPEVTDADRSLVFETITDRSAFDALEAEWNGLFARAGASHQLFQTFNWCWHWCNHYLREDRGRLAIVTGRRAGRLALVWPLVRQSWLGARVLSWMGEPVSQYGDVLVEKGPDRARLLAGAWRHIVETGGADLVRLRKVRGDAAVAPLLEASHAHVTAEMQAPYLDLGSAPDFDTYQKRYPGRARKNRRRHRRRLAEHGPLAFDFLAEGPEARALVRAALAMKRAWLRDRGLTSRAFADGRLERFFLDVAGDRTRPTGCRVSVLSCAGQPAAIEVAFVCGTRCAAHIGAYDLAFERHSPGSLQLEDTFARCYDEGIEVYDLLAPADAYKTMWADAAVPVRDHVLALTARGRLTALPLIARLGTRAKAAIARAPAWVRRPLLPLQTYMMSL